MRAFFVSSHNAKQWNDSLIKLSDTYLCHLALPAVVNSRLFHVNFVSCGKPFLKTASFSSWNSCWAYLTRFSLSRAAWDLLSLGLGTSTSGKVFCPWEPPKGVFTIWFGNQGPLVRGTVKDILKISAYSIGLSGSFILIPVLGSAFSQNICSGKRHSQK
jgi:hypothetical protein